MSDKKQIDVQFYLNEDPNKQLYEILLKYQMYLGITIDIKK
jgi:hypothetical protein